MRLNIASKLFIFALLLGFLGVSVVKGIELYGRIRGLVTDPSGAVIAGAIVRVTNDATGISKTVVTSTTGSYEAVQLPAPSTYTVRVEMKGFRTHEVQRISLGVDQIYVVNAQLEVGPVMQVVSVEATPAQIEKTSMQLSATLRANAIVDMPLNGRNWVNLQLTLPGVVSASDRLGVNTSSFATNGSESDQNSYLVNGVDSNEFGLNTALVIPSPDAIAEVTMVTNTINPEYGRNSGAILNAVTKSGSNSFHGSGFEFYRDTSLNARNFFNRKPTIFHRNQFGGTVGGPVWKNHTFFFFSYQGTRQVFPQAGYGVVPVFTADQRNGIWPGLATSAKTSPFPLVGEDGTTYPAGKAYSTIFPTGHIPTGDFNPISASLMNKFVPLPNVGADYQFSPTVKQPVNQYLARIDHTFSSKDSLWGSWFYQYSPRTQTEPFTGATLPGFGDFSTQRTQQYVLTWNHTFGASTLNEVRLGYTRLNYRSVFPQSIVDPKSVGFTGINVQHPELANYPRIDVTGFFRLGFSTNGPQPRLPQTYQLDDNFTKLVGRHTFKMGFDMRRFELYNVFGTILNGYYKFNTSAKYSTGSPGADFLLGIPQSYTQGSGDTLNVRAREYYTYFQDQYKIRPNLTLTYGTGWTIVTPQVDNFHSNHAMIAFRPGQQSTVFPTSPPGYVFQGDAGVNASGTTHFKNFGPRVGFAWSPGTSGKWAVRGGYGIYFNFPFEELALQFVSSPPFGITSTGAAAGGFAPSFANPFVDIAGRGSVPNLFPYFPSSNVDFGAFEPLLVNVMDPAFNLPYSQNFNLTVERQVTPTTIARLAYVGALGRRLIFTRELNPGIAPAACAADPACVDDRDNQQVDYPNHFRYPGDIFGSVFNTESGGISNYNSFQASLEKRMSHGLGLSAAYTWSHAMDTTSGFENSSFGGGGAGYGGFGYLRETSPFNRRLYDYGPSIYDARQRLVISYTYEIPVPKVNNWAAKRLLDGWRFSGITSFQIGFPLDVIDSNETSLTCSTTNSFEGICWDVPNVVGPAQYFDPRNSRLVNKTSDPSATRSRNNYWFNPNTFAFAEYGTQGNAGRNLLRGPGINNFDFAFFKRTNITERTQIELRFEFFNLFNHTQFDPIAAATDINDPNFGRITNAHDPRLIQLAAKFYF